MRIIFKNAAVLDAERGTLVPDRSVLVADGRIAEIGPSSEVHNAAGRTIDLRDAYLSDVHPEDIERVRATIDDSLWSGEHHLEYRIVWPDHSVHWVEARGRLLRDGSGEPMACAACAWI